MVKKPRISEKPLNPKHQLQQSIEVSNFLAHHDVIVDYLCCLLDDCHTLLPLYGKLQLERDKETVRARFSREGLSFATKTLPSFFDAVLQHLEHGKSDYPGFKKLRGRTYPVFLQQLVAPIIEKPHDDVTVTYMKCLYQFCVPFKKLQGPYKKSVLDHELAKFKETDQNLPDEEDIVDDVKLSTIVQVASVIIEELFKGFDPFDRTQSQEFLPGPGPGATNTPTLPNERYRPHVDYASITELFPLKEWYNHTSVAPQIGKFDLRVGKRCVSHVKIKRADRPSSRFTFVPKTYSKPRGICIEQLEMQWQQQGIRKAMYAWIENHPRTKGFVNFTNQRINAELALAASLDRTLATIDMSEASDRIPVWLVKRLFAGCEPLLKALLACRTEIIEFERRQESKFAPWIKAKKFAPMGSALCFPVMGIVHFALLRAILLLSKDRQTQKDLDVWVYGDDLILSSTYINEVYSILPKFGMKLNESKSYSVSHFRESCGCHAYKGVEITPTRFKTIVKFPPSYNDLVSALETEAQLYKKGYFETASLIRSQILLLKQFGGSYFPTVTKESSILGWIRDSDACVDIDITKVKSRWNDDLQRREYKLRYLHNIGEKLAKLPDNEAYLRCLILKPRSTVSITRKLHDSELKFKETTSKDVGEILPKKQLRTGWFPLSDLRPHATCKIVAGWLGD